jgi:cytochrome P450
MQSTPRRGMLEHLLERHRSAELQLLRRSAEVDPYPTYRQLREENPILRSSLGYWLVTGYDECADLIKRPEVGAMTDFMLRPDVGASSYPLLQQFYREWFLFADPPRHAETRKRVSACTTSSIRDTVQESVGPLAKQAVERIDWSTPTDVIVELARPYPMAVLAKVLGVPSEDLPRLRSWTVVMSESMEVFAGEERLRRAERAAQQVRAYLLSRAWNSGEASRRSLACLLSGEELELETGVANAALLMAAGQETTVNAIGSSVLAVLSHPEAVESLRPDSEVQPEAIEELLRFTSPIQVVVRRVKRPFAFGRQRFERGEIMWLFLGAANRDPRVFDDPDELHFDRLPNAHLTFGSGSHLCFGASLTRAELRATMNCLTPVLPRLEVDRDSISWQRKRTVRGLDGLRVRPKRM